MDFMEYHISNTLNLFSIIDDIAYRLEFVSREKSKAFFLYILNSFYMYLLCSVWEALL